MEEEGRSMDGGIGYGVWKDTIGKGILPPAEHNPRVSHFI